MVIVRAGAGAGNVVWNLFDIRHVLNTLFPRALAADTTTERDGNTAMSSLIRSDLEGVVDVIMAIAKVIENDPSSILELDINPLMLLPESQGAVAADALISLSVELENPETTESQLKRVI